MFVEDTHRQFSRLALKGGRESFLFGPLPLVAPLVGRTRAEARLSRTEAKASLKRPRAKALDLWNSASAASHKASEAGFAPLPRSRLSVGRGLKPAWKKPALAV